MAPLLYTPEFTRKYYAYVNELAKLPGLDIKPREVAILVVGAKYQAAYELYAHVRNGVQAGGLTEAEAHAIAKGEKPGSLVSL